MPFVPCIMYPMGLNPPNILLRLKWPFRASGFTPIQTPQVWRKENRDVGGGNSSTSSPSFRRICRRHLYISNQSCFKSKIFVWGQEGGSFFLHFNKKDPGLFLFVVWKKKTNFILENSSENLERFLRDTTWSRPKCFFGDEAPNRNKDLESVSFSMGIRESQGPFEPSPENFPQISCWMSWYNSEMEWQTSLADVSSGWVDHMSPDFIIFCDRKTANGIRDVQNNVDVRPYKSLAILERNCLSTFQTSC